MLYGIGCDLCELAHLEKSLTGAHAAAFVRRVYGEAERAALAAEEAAEDAVFAEEPADGKDTLPDDEAPAAEEPAEDSTEEAPAEEVSIDEAPAEEAPEAPEA